ncbi:hypothetical protein CS063_07635 [Sporanaerobium hydrogeniformans]|uniref:Uncharacterized protein n=1 Tax=Sporanaerobium hydrogeniformans TaxID=3072179 RepID=A0AC61DD46_9FIRM|nr:glycosyltransferase [Sporanaerobium hydrogeniformans]PHV70887.1 hypothetical protein CS063_07635 [Sporanaerobium hydrogeniformans]
MSKIYRIPTTQEKKTLISFILYHHKSLGEDELLLTIDTYLKQQYLDPLTSIEVIVLLDEIQLQELPILEHATLPLEERLIVIEGGEEFKGPGALWNEGFKIARGELVTFTWTGVKWFLDTSVHLVRMIKTGELDCAYSRAVYKLPTANGKVQSILVGEKDLSIHFLSFTPSIPLNYTIIKAEVVKELGGFCENREFAKIADWELMLRLFSQYRSDGLLGSYLVLQKRLQDIDYGYPFRYSWDDLVRVFISKTSSFFNVLMPKGSRKETLLPEIKFEPHKEIKIGIVSGLLENAQVQIEVLNYLEFLGLTYPISWRRFIENQTMPEELKNYDIVFFIRSRTGEALELAKYCYKEGIKTVYILDDNWFYVTETYPQLASQLGKDTSYYQYFILILTTVDYVITYNDILYEDTKKYNHNVFKLPPNVNLEHFYRPEALEEDTSIRIGFTGSSSKLQHFGPAFKALYRILSEYPEVKLYFKGIPLPPEFTPFRDRIIETSYSHNYKDYANEVSKWRYDIMISPIDETRYTNSKCPCKYFDATAVGAAGIYATTELMRKVVKPNRTGLLIENKEEAWYQALKKLIIQPSLREAIVKNAREDIEKNYDTKAVASYFILFLQQVLGRKL